MENLKVAFDILDIGAKPRSGYSKASGHIIFDVRMTLERKARWVEDGHITHYPKHPTFTGVVLRERVRVLLTYAALNTLHVYASDIQNAYLQAPTSEKHYIICGTEFGLENVGEIVIVVRAIYGDKASGSDYWMHIRATMKEMKFEPYTANPDVWFRSGTKDNGSTYYQYVLLFYFAYQPNVHLK